MAIEIFADCECGGEVKISNIKGTYFPYKANGNVRLSTDFDAPKCESCGEIFLRGSDCEKIDEMLDDLLEKLWEV